MKMCVKLTTWKIWYLNLELLFAMSKSPNVYTHTFCIHFTLYICASICPVEQLITEHLINIATTSHQKPVLAKHYCSLCLTLVVGYIKPKHL